MSVLRGLLDDLVAKRLWPIALLLLITAVAVPVVLGHGAGGAGGAAAVAPSVAPAADVTGSTPAVRVVGPASARSRPGAVRDPFRRNVKAAARRATEDGAPTTSTTATTATKRGATETPAASASPSASTKPVTPTEQGGATASPAPATTRASVYRARIRWGRDETAAVRGVSRLEALGDPSNPALLYLGTTPDHALALFLLGPNATATGEGTCVVTPWCRLIALKAGQAEKIVVADPTGGAAQHHALAIDAIAAVPATGGDALTRVDADGRDVLREMIKDPKTAAAIGLFFFDARLGAIVPRTAA